MDISVNVGDDHVAVVEFDNPPHNHFDMAMLGGLADVYERLEDDPACRAIVLSSTGRHFCAGADFSDGADFGDGAVLAVRAIYEQAYRLFAAGLPVVAAVQGAAVGGGLGLALSADFRVAAPPTRFQANFARLGIHHGFGLTVTLPRAIGEQRAAELLLTGRAVKGEEALAIGLCDRLAPPDELRAHAHAFAAEIAAGAPIAVRSMRATIRGDLAERVNAATDREAAEQAELFTTEDFREGVSASRERRSPRFDGR
ncbi:MAG: enoyl-CoA hydratase/isomerase family protein [Actinomycetota bacterium]|nr:enoyl-CoA hydratase/isomerase family protein [Actinomycetota bacterium]